VSTNTKSTTSRIAVIPVVFITDVPSYAEQFIGGLLPELFLITAISIALVALSFGLGQNQNRKALALSSLNALVEAMLFVAALYLVQLILSAPALIFNGYIVLSSYTSFIKLIIVLSCCFITANSKLYVTQQASDLLEYAVIISLATVLILLIVSSSHFVAAFIALVGFSLNLYVLIFSDASTAAVREGGVKYFYLSTLSSGLLLYGIFLLYFILKTGQFFEINQLFSTDLALILNTAALTKLATVLILVGLFFKLSAFPGHL
jgi:NADH-quinone oxidoreductase subunit N